MKFEIIVEVDESLRFGKITEIKKILKKKLESVWGVRSVVKVKRVKEYVKVAKQESLLFSCSGCCFYSEDRNSCDLPDGLGCTTGYIWKEKK